MVAHTEKGGGGGAVPPNASGGVMELYGFCGSAHLQLFIHIRFHLL